MIFFFILIAMFHLSLAFPVTLRPSFIWAATCKTFVALGHSCHRRLRKLESKSLGVSQAYMQVLEGKVGRTYDQADLPLHLESR